MGKLTQEQKEKSLAFLEKLISFDLLSYGMGKTGRRKRRSCIWQNICGSLDAV